MSCHAFCLGLDTGFVWCCGKVYVFKGNRTFLLSYWPCLMPGPFFFKGLFGTFYFLLFAPFVLRFRLFLLSLVPVSTVGCSRLYFVLALMQITMHCSISVSRFCGTTELLSHVSRTKRVGTHAGCAGCERVQISDWHLETRRHEWEKHERYRMKQKKTNKQIFLPASMNGLHLFVMRTTSWFQREAICFNLTRFARRFWQLENETLYDLAPW